MKNALFLLLTLPLFAQAQATAESFLCTSENPRGAIALTLSETGPSIGRISHNWTRSSEDLLTADKDQYNSLFVGFVKKLGPAHFTFNASVYRLVNHPEVIALTKSELKGNKLRHHIGDQKWLDFTCKKVKELK